jgi:hypothetical protein
MFYWNLTRRPTAELEARLADLRAAQEQLARSSQPPAPAEVIAALQAFAEMLDKEMPGARTIRLYVKALDMPGWAFRLAAGRLLKRHRFGQRFPTAGEFHETVEAELGDVQHWRTRLRCGVESLERALAAQAKKPPEASNGASSST